MTATVESPVMPLIAILSLLALVVIGPTAGDAQHLHSEKGDFGQTELTSQDPEYDAFHGTWLDYNEFVTNYAADSILRRIGRPVGRLDILTTEDSTRHCTAFFVDDRYILTSAHCLPAPDGKEEILVAFLVIGFDDRFAPETAQRLVVDPTPVEFDDETGYAILSVFGGLGAFADPVILSTQEVGNDRWLFVIGHPQGEAQRVARERCQSGSPAQNADGGFLHHCDTVPGNEGSPIFVHTAARFVVVGLHYAGLGRYDGARAVAIADIAAVSPILQSVMRSRPKTCSVPDGGCDP